MVLNIPDVFPADVRRYGNPFLDSLLCIRNHNFYRNICKGCYAQQMRQGLDQYSYRNGTVIRHKKDDFRVLELRFPGFWNHGSKCSGIIRVFVKSNIIISLAIYYMIVVELLQDENNLRILWYDNHAMKKERRIFEWKKENLLKSVKH